MRRAKSKQSAAEMDVVERLELFVTCAQEILNTRLAQTGIPEGYSLRGNVETGEIELVPAPVDEDDLRSFLMALRPFTAAQDPVYMSSIYPLCLAHIEHDESKAILKDDARKWRNVLRSAGIQLVVDGREYTPEYMFTLWFNGHYFHKAPEHRKALEQLLPFDRALYSAPQKLDSGIS